MKIEYCDRCGKEVNKHTFKELVWNMLGVQFPFSNIQTVRVNGILCKNCHKDLCKWFNEEKEAKG